MGLNFWFDGFKFSLKIYLSSLQGFLQALLNLAVIANKKNASKFCHKNSSKPLNFAILIYFCHTELSQESEVSQNTCHTDLSCHTERSEVSINSKCDFSALRRVLNSVNFSLTLKMTKYAFFVSGFFVVATPCKQLCCFLAKTQNNKSKFHCACTSSSLL